MNYHDIPKEYRPAVDALQSIMCIKRWASAGNKFIESDMESAVRFAEDALIKMEIKSCE